MSIAIRNRRVIPGLQYGDNLRLSPKLLGTLFATTCELCVIGSLVATPVRLCMLPCCT